MADPILIHTTESKFLEPSRLLSDNKCDNVLKSESPPTVRLSDSPNPKKKKSVSFNDVKLFLFERTQGFECIPSDDSKNSITLGMSYKHTHLEHFDKLDDYLKYKRKCHLKKLEKKKKKILCIDENLLDLQIFTCDDLIDEANTEDENRKILEVISNKEEYENIEKDLPINMDFFCPVLNPAERRQKLIQAGLKEFDESESKEIKSIKESRQICGCKCSQLGLTCGVDEKCICFANGIGCQLDKTKYPCSCTVRKCKNPFGLKRFDQKAVLKHYKEVLFSDKYPPDINPDLPEVNLISSTKSDNKRKRKRKNGFQPLNLKKCKTKIDSQHSDELS